MKQFKILFFFSLLLFSSFSSYSQNESSFKNDQEKEEKILQFHSDILIKENGNIVVTETIKLYVSGLKIEHGIFRELPMKNYSYKVSRNSFYTLLSVTKNGLLESFHTKIQDDKYAIYIGDKDRTLSEGLYTYVLTYEVEAQIHSDVDFDEIYWNVTGNYWALEIEKVTATVILPESATALQTHCYTGVEGSKESECNVKTSDNFVYFDGRNLKVGEGFTIAVGFPKGFVKQSSFLPHYKMEEFLSVEKVVAGLLAVFICFAFYLFSWKRHGKDAVYAATNETLDLRNIYSAAALQYIKERYSNSKTLLTAIISLSIKGAMEIGTNGKKNWENGFEYVLEKRDNTVILDQEEQIVLDHLFKVSDSFSLNPQSYLTFETAEKALENSLKSQINLKDYFSANWQQIAIGFLITIATIVGYCYYAKGTILGWPIFGFIFLVCTVLLLRAIVKLLVRKQFLGAFGALLMTFFSGTFCYASFFAINVDKDYSVLNALVLFLIIGGFSIYLHLITAYTSFGIITKYHTEKLKQQLLDYPIVRNTTAIVAYEENLPYAFALGIQEEWNIKFNSVLQDLNYTSNWIQNSNSSPGFSTDILVHFSSNYNATSTSSSRASSGGGSSGGGW